MHCMKCGKQIKEDQVFCEACLEIMERFPVKPGTRVQLPSRPDPTVKKPAQRKTPLSPKEQNLRLRKAMQWMAAVLAVSLLALAITVSLLVHTLQDRNAQGTIGRNYNTVSTDIGGK